VRTIAEFWGHAAATDRGYPAFLTRDGDGWREIGWREAAERVDELAAGFLALGIRKGDAVGIVSRTRLEWTLCDYALASIGAVVIPIYQTSTRKECAYFLSDSGARAVVCENEEQLGKVRGLGAEAPALEHLVGIDEAGADEIALDELAARGRAQLESDARVVADARDAVTEADVLTFLYTSGTTGNPKGCVVSHRNFASVVEAVEQIKGLFGPGDTVLLFLPLAHNFARLVQYAGGAIGLTIAFCPDVTDVARALEQTRPQIFPSVPRLFEKVHTSVRANLEKTTGFRRRLADWALAVGRRAAARRQEGRRVPPLLALQHKIADRLVFSKIKARLGGRLRCAISGGAPLSREIIEFFAACDILILEGYGLSETTSGCALNRPTNYRFGTVGLPLPGIELRIAEDGEILVRGESVFHGYHRRPEATAEVLADDGWLRTGDIGTLHEDGFLTITDRKKEIIVTAGGKKISPQNLENALKASGYVSQALIVGDGRPYIAALISPDRDEVDKRAKNDEEVRALIQRVVDEVNANVGPTEQIRRFALMAREFSMEHGEVTPTLKLKRRVCQEHFREEIERIYAGSRGSG
jgi:long-chain acyl-CoA synthetase